MALGRKALHEWQSSICLILGLCRRRIPDQTANTLLNAEGVAHRSLRLRGWIMGRFLFLKVSIGISFQENVLRLDKRSLKFTSKTSRNLVVWSPYKCTLCLFARWWLKPFTLESSASAITKPIRTRHYYGLTRDKLFRLFDVSVHLR